MMQLGLQYFLNLPYDKDYVIGYTAIAFLLGYIVNTLGSWLEVIYFFTWGGKPSNRLLDGKGTWKIKLYHHVALRANLVGKAAGANPKNDELFAIAMRNVAGVKDTRIEDFNAIYAFSRTLLTTVLIGGILILIKNSMDWHYHAVVIPAIIVMWVRCKQRGYYLQKKC
ncbi:hypothetical protein [Chitinophaga sancti]|uniref:Uncharacterized protein n=1 Tax=Chitinophaga sancti TaxID=1004 RepID=A0A1K1RX14_9BACT|nr:hypothetical protein [Chitinophaga sancti]WQD63982.1 hypothetical protein U0033_06200 [Chitinophaga sancti]WQG90394.1 hypothetical protein SR876_02720 [Chitinophaga sancti]SFW76311.1 hypothetical protein SAMN05661012_04329 [Chitinophaga sancti]